MSHAQTARDLTGSYRIEGGEGYEEDGMFHQFYLHTDGTFYLAAEWDQFETSRFAGTWHVAGDWVELSGQANVQTSHGSWVTEFTRSFRISQANGVWVLTPNPLKNRFGMMGWPNPFTYYRSSPVPNLPVQDLPLDEPSLLERIYELAPATRPKN